MAERRSAELDERLRVATAEAARLRAAIEALPHAVVVCDAAGDVVLRNRRSHDVEGGRHAAPLVEQAVEEVVAAGGGLASGGEDPGAARPPPRTLEVTGTPMGRSDRPLGTVVLVDDVSELRRLEAVRRDFVANVSHELRTPVGAMGVLAETLADEADPEVMRRLASRITSEAERAGRLIDGLLDLSRIEAGGRRRARCPRHGRGRRRRRRAGGATGPAGRRGLWSAAPDRPASRSAATSASWCRPSSTSSRTR